jgi:EmrB/QacA subfamily drug resistance transporter
MHSRGWTLAVVSAATALLLLDVTVVNVALPAMEDDLHASFSELQWVIDAYALTLAVLLLSAGSLADRIGRRAVFAAGLAVFTLSSTACAAAGSAVALDVARAAQGVGAAAMFATSLALLANEFPPADRGGALAIWGAISGGALAIGPLVGGALVDGPGWRWVFILNLPLGAALLVATLARVRESRDPASAASDWRGAAVFTVAAFALVYGLIRGNPDGWGSPHIVAALVVAVVGLATFCLLELRTPRPMLDLRLFRIPAFTGTAIVAFAQSFALYPMFLFLALYFQDVLGYTPLETGVRILPLTVALFAVAPLSGRLVGRVPLRMLLATGLALIGTGALLMRALEPSSEWTTLLPGFIAGGIGIGVISPPLAAAMVGVLSADRAGLASGINNTFRQLGIAVGIAGLGAIFQHHLTAAYARASALLREGHYAALDRLFHQGGHTISHGTRTASVFETGGLGYVDGLDAIFLVAGLVALAAVPVALLLVRGRDL